jgi:hypothetical protein
VIVAVGVFAGVMVARGSRSAAGNSARGRKDTGQVSAPPSHGTAGATTLPAGYDWYSVPAASAGTLAGFRLAVPAGWRTSTEGLTTYVREPRGAGFMEIDLTGHTLAAPLADAHWLEHRSIREGKFPGYQPLSIRLVQVSGSRAALWSFTWQEDGAGRVFARDYLFDLTTSAGPQSYAVYGSAPAASWRQSAQMLAEAIRTFRPLT